MGLDRKPQDKYPFYILCAAAAYTVIFSIICIIRFRSYSYHDFDLAISIQKYWNILHSDGRMSLIGDVNIWGNSLELIAYPMSFVYWLFGSSPEAMLAVQSAAIGFAAVPIFLISRMYLGERLSACIAISYLLNPCVWYINLSEYHDLTFCMIALPAAFYFMKKSRFAACMAFILLSMACRIDVALVTAMFGIYALSERKEAKWVVWPLVAGIVWLAAGLFLILPAAGGEVRYDVYYSHLGKDFPGIIRNIFTDPLAVLRQLFTGENAVFAAQLLFPAGFVPLLGFKEIAVCFLSFLQHAVSLRPEEHMIRYHYAATLVPFIYIAYAAGLGRIAGRFKPWILAALVVCLPLVTNFYYGPSGDIKAIAKDASNTEINSLKEAFVRRIPGDAPAIGTFEFLSHMANREKLYSFHYVVRGDSGASPLGSWRPSSAIEYALVDFNDGTMPYFTDGDSDIRIRDFLESGGFGAVDSFDTVVLFRKGHIPGKTLFRPEASVNNAAVPLARIGGNVTLERFTIKKEGRFVDISIRWKCLDPIKDNVSYLFQVMDKNGKEAYSTVKPVCYGMYPMRRWKKGEVVTDDFRMFVPVKAAQRGEYDIRMTLFLDDSMRALMIEKVGSVDINDRYGLLLGPVSF